MKSVVFVILVCQTFAMQSCASKRYEGEGQCWINVKYVECLKNGLPCECQQLTQTYYSLVIETHSGRKNFGVALSKFDQMEPYIYPIKMIKDNEFAILESNENNTSWASVSIKGEELQLVENGVVSKFIRSNKTDEYDVQHYLVDNVDLLNKSFNIRGYPSLQEVVDRDSLRCDCNKWLGNVDVLYVKGAPQSWVLEIKDDSLEINRIINVDRDPDDSIQTEKVNSFRWR